MNLLTDSAHGRPRGRTFFALSVAAWSVVVLIPMACGQINTAALSGAVMDGSGGAVTGVNVKVAQEDTNLTFSGQTDGIGRYTFLALPVGLYRITATRTGFKTIEREFELTVSQAANLNLVMDVGQTAEVVDVTAQAPLVNATNSTVSTVVEERSMFDLPLNGRNFASLITLTPGVSPTDVSQSGAGPSIQGQRNRDNSYQADGVSIARVSFGTIVMTPPLDSIREFRVQSINADAEFGQYSGGHINLVTKSGTDKFHGSVYEYLRNDALDARNTFQPVVPAYRQNQYGFSLGGPIYIPKIYPYKSKSWFFLSYEGFKLRQAGSTLGTVPTTQELAGNFSGIANLIYNPFSTAPSSSNSAQVTRQPFSGNQIPVSLINPVAVSFAKSFIASPNISIPGSPSNFINTAPNFSNLGTWMGRIDQSVTQNNRVSVRWLQNDSTSGATLPVGTNLVAGNFAAPRNQSAEWNSSLSPTLILTLRYGFDKSNVLSSSALVPGYYDSSGFNNPNGFPGSMPGISLLPQIGITGYSVALGQNYNTEEVTSHTGTADLEKVWKKHTFKAGFNINHIGSFNGALNPSESFGVAQTQNLISPTGTGDGFASFLLGLPSTAGRLIGSALLGMSGAFTGVYIQDTIHVTPRLALNLGIRWDHAGQFSTDSVLGSFDQRGGGWLLTGPVGIPGAVFQGPNARPGILDPVWKDFGPRAGAAYQMAKQLVIRGGYGLFYDTVAGRWQWVQGPRVAWPRAQFQTTPTLNATVPQFTIDQPFVGLPSNPYLPNPFLNADGTPAYPTGSQINPVFKTPRVHEWNIAVERQFSDSLVASVTYVGTAGRLLDCCGLINQDYQNGAGNTNTKARPYPQMGVFRTDRNDGYSDYEALELKVEQRFSRGLSYMGNYTFSKSTDLACSGYIGAEGCGFTQPYYPTAYKYGLDHALSAFDIRHVANLTLIYELPIGKGKAVPLNHPVLDALAGGWQISAIVSFRSGMPLTAVEANSAQTNVGAGVTPRPDLVGDVSNSNPTRFQWFNTAAFANPSGFNYGTAGRNIIIGPTSHTENISLFKNFNLKRDAVRLQYRADMFNAFNATVFGNPGLTLGTAQFGQISSANPGRIIQMALKVIF